MEMDPHGIVSDGMGHCSKWPEHLCAHYSRLSGLRIIPGTLNVELEEAFVLSGAPRLAAHEWEGADDVFVASCTVNGYPGAIIRTEANNLGIGPVLPTVLEIASDTLLRTHLGIQTGEAVTVRVDN